jgi:sigma-B regulation protein RsbU (phosphoserine phosphatase)
VIRGYEVAGRTIPAQLVGGDYFDFIPIDEKRWAICLGDVSGKGLPAALLMANLQATIRGQTLWSPSACDCMDRSNKLLFRSTDPSKFATLFYGVLNIQSNWLCYSNAGHNPPLLMSNGREPVPLTSGGIMLGLIENSSFEEEVVPLRPHDLLVIYSDGITDAENLQEEEFGEQRLVALLNQHRAASACDLVEKILAAVQFHSRGAEQTDDITLVVVKRNQARDS